MIVHSEWLLELQRMRLVGGKRLYLVSSAEATFASYLKARMCSRRDEVSLERLYKPGGPIGHQCFNNLSH